MHSALLGSLVLPITTLMGGSRLQLLLTNEDPYIPLIVMSGLVFTGLLVGALCGAALGALLHHKRSRVDLSVDPNLKVACCASCGVQCSAIVTLHEVDRSFNSAKLLLCSVCRARREHLDYRIAWCFLVGSSALGLGLVAFVPSFHLGWIILNLVLLVVFESLVIVPHELGHAACAWLFGMGVTRIRLGRAKTVLRFTVLGIIVEINSVPLEGVVYAVHPTVRFLRTRQFLFYLAGPFANALLLVVVVWWIGPNRLLMEIDQFPLRLIPELAFAAANLVVLVTALTPRDHIIEGTRRWSDGKGLLLVPFLSQQELGRIFGLCPGPQLVNVYQTYVAPDGVVYTDERSGV